MKRRPVYLFLALFLVLGLALAACAPEAAPPPSGGEGEQQPPEQEQQPPAQQQGEVYKLAWQDISPPGAAIYMILEELADRVRVASDGRLDITLYSEGEITPRDETTPAVRDRAVDIATNAASMDLNRMGPVMYLMGGSGTPAGPTTADILAWIRQGGGLDVMRGVYDDWGLVLGGDPGAAELFAHSNKPLTTAKDFDGLKFRTLGVWGEILAEYGASVVQIPGGELYQAVERGVIDAFELGPPSYNWPQGFQEILDYIGVPGIQSPGYINVILMNHDSWNELPPDLQGILEGEIQAMEYYGQLQLKEADAQAMDNFIAYGTKIFTVSDDFQQDIALKSRAYMENYAAQDATFQMVWDHQVAFFKHWHSLQGIDPAYTMFD
jgi:TRAP-type mannitol/chloroaromatic compound transport system substrate-binding protein